MLIKPADVLKKVSELKLKNTVVIFYLDKNKEILSSHKKKYQNCFNLKINDIFIPAFYLGAKFIIVANATSINKKYQSKNLEKEFVKRTFKTGCFLNIYLLDYLIINKNKYYSFHESNII